MKSPRRGTSHFIAKSVSALIVTVLAIETAVVGTRRVMGALGMLETEDGPMPEPMRRPALVERGQCLALQREVGQPIRSRSRRRRCCCSIDI